MSQLWDLSWGFAMVEEIDAETAMKNISRNGIFPILKSLEENPQKFSDLMFETRLNPGVVDKHLKLLTDYGIVRRENNLYGLTEKGRMLLPALKEVIDILT